MPINAMIGIDRNWLELIGIEINTTILIGIDQYWSALGNDRGTPVYIKSIYNGQLLRHYRKKLKDAVWSSYIRDIRDYDE